MKVSVRVKGKNRTSKFVRWAQDRIGDAFARISHQVRSVEAFFSDINGPRGGRDQNLLLAVRMWDGRVVAVRTVEENMGRALDTGVDRSIHAVIKRLQRSRAQRRRWHPLAEAME
jgi:hypothetical protein